MPLLTRWRPASAAPYMEVALALPDIGRWYVFFLNSYSRLECTASDHAAAPSQGLTYPSIPATAASNMRAAILLVIAAMQTHAWAPGNVRVAAWPCPATTAHAQCSASLRKSSLQPRLRMSSSLYNDQQAAMARRAEQVLQAAARLWNTSD